MKPKLIILNGACGSGKSTLAKLYAEAHPMTLRIDTDEIRRLMSDYREHASDSGPLSKKLTLAMARTYLAEGRDVVMAQLCGREEYLKSLEDMVAECGADLYEFLLDIPKEEAVRRFIERGQENGFSDGFDSEGSIALRGKEKRLEEMHDEMMEIVFKRPQTIRIHPKPGDAPGTYVELMKYLNIK